MTDALRRPDRRPILWRAALTGGGAVLGLAAVSGICVWTGVARLNGDSLARRGWASWLALGAAGTAYTIAVAAALCFAILAALRVVATLRVFNKGAAVVLRRGRRSVRVTSGDTVSVHLAPHWLYRSFGEGVATRWTISCRDSRVHFPTFYNPDQQMLDDLRIALLERGVSLDVSIARMHPRIPGRRDDDPLNAIARDLP